MKPINSFRKSMIAFAVGSVTAFAGGMSSIAYAQENDDVDTLEEVIVTGSRIQRSNLSSPIPVQILGSETIELSAQTNIGDLINQLPSAGVPTSNRTNANFQSNGSGVVNINYRNLGEERTLTLVNGRRFVGGVPGSSAVDLNSIPTALIERAELITGGRSAIYGSDAVAGVVNFVLKNDYEGLELSARYEESGEGDGEQTVIDLLFGKNFDEGRGNAVVNVTYSDQQAVFARNRSNLALDTLSSGFFGGNFLDEQVFRSSFPPQGRFDATQTGTGNNFTFLPDGTLVDSFFANGNDALGRGPDGFNRQAFRAIALPVERFLVTTNVKYDFTESTSLFFEGTYVNSSSQSRLEPFPLDSDDIFNDGSAGIPVRHAGRDGNIIVNPLIPQAIVNAADGAGVENIRFRRRLVEFGARGAANERQTFRGVLGLQGSFADKYNWDLSYNYGQTTQNQSSEGQIDVTQFRNALIVEPDGAGQLRCVDAFAEASGCQPLNVFGFNSISQGALNFVSAEQSRFAKITQQVLQANVTGPLAKLPAGDLQFAVGFEYRDESSDARNDALTARGLNSSNAIPNVSGSFDVTEVYAELDIPLIEDNFFDYASLALAARASDYSTVGSTTTFESSFVVRPVENVTLRGSVAKAVRAPNIDDLFDPGGQTFAQVSDPCANVTASTPGIIADNCRADPGIAQRIAATGAFNLTQSELQGTTGFLGGNPNLDEEEADTLTIGVVYLPTFLPNDLRPSLTIDYFDIEVEDAIFTITQNNVLDLCYNSVGLSAAQCDQITRNPITSTQRGSLNRVDSGAANVASITTSGVDVAFDMDFEFNGVPGRFNINTAYTYLDDFTVVPLPGEAPDNETGEVGDAEHRWNAKLRYQNEGFLTQLEVRYIGESRIEDTDLDDAACALENCIIDNVIYADLQARYSFESAFLGSDKTVEVFGGVRNLFDEEAPLIPSGLTDSDTGTSSNGGVYDVIGRSFYLGAKVKF